VRATRLPGVAWRPVVARATLCSLRYNSPRSGMSMAGVRPAGIAESANPGATPPEQGLLGHGGLCSARGWENAAVFVAAVHERPLVDRRWPRDSLSTRAVGLGSWQPMGVRSGQNGVRALRFRGRSGDFAQTPTPTAGDVRWVAPTSLRENFEKRNRVQPLPWFLWKQCCFSARILAAMASSLL
jgi:hypothetical protein